MRLTLAATLATTLAATLAVSLVGPLAAGAQQPDASPFKPVETPKLDPEVFAPYPERRGPNPQDLVGSGQRKLPQPSGVEIGRYDKYQLNFDAARTSDVVPRPGFEDSDPSNPARILQREKPERVMPNYFGLKLSAPTN
jgi:hypothetical protein